MKTLVTFSALAIGGYALYRYREILGQVLVSGLTDVFSTPVQPDFRFDFRETQTVIRPVRLPHSHPESAAERTSCNETIDRLATRLGLDVISISSSNRDLRSGNDCQRLFFETKDLTSTCQYSRVERRHLIKLVDVDYYVDLKDLMAAFRPICMYTFVPETLSDCSKEWNFFVDSEGFVNMNYLGGGSYRHQLWDYDHDTITADYWWGSVVFHVEQRRISKHRRLIYLNPIRKVYGPFARFLAGYRLRRLVLSNNGVCRLDTFLDGQNLTCFSIGGRSTAVIPTEIFEAAQGRCDFAKDPSISDVERIFRAHEVPKPDIAAVLFMQCYRKRLPVPPIQRKIPSQYEDQHSYQTLAPLVTEDGKTTARQILHPLYPAGFAPKRSINNDQACLEGRVFKPRNPNKPVPARFHKYKDEFLKLLIPADRVQTFVPYEEAFVEAKQNRPTQRAAANKTKPFSHYLRFAVSAFQKKEIYGKIGAPRNISNVPTDHRLRYSAFMYAIKDMLKLYPWYCFGLNPKQITERIRELASRADVLTTNDYSNYDGSHGQFKFDFDCAVLRRAFAPMYHPEVLALKNVMANAHGFTSHGLHYTTGYSVLSGTAETSDFNTVFNALVAYICLRETHLDPDTAWNSLGLFAGDDNVNAGIPADLHVRVCKQLGYELKTEIVSSGQPLMFLGRLFLDPWATDSSVCDLPRRLRGLHLTIVSSNVPDAVVLRRKAESYRITDPETPLIREWCDFIFRHTKTSDKFESECHVERPFFLDPINNWSIPSKIEQDFVLQWAAQQMACDPLDLRRLAKQLKQAKTLDFKFSAIAVEPKTTVAAVVGDTIV